MKTIHSSSPWQYVGRRNTIAEVDDVSMVTERQRRDCIILASVNTTTVSGVVDGAVILLFQQHHHTAGCTPILFHAGYVDCMTALIGLPMTDLSDLTEF